MTSPMVSSSTDGFTERGRRLPAAIRHFSEVVRSHSVVQRLYILVVCLAYLMHNIWLARTIFLFAVIPVYVVARVPFASFRPILKSNVFVAAAAFLLVIPATSLLADATSVPLVVKHLRYALMVGAFLVITADLTRGPGDFPRLLMLFVAPAAAIGALIDIGAFAGALSWDTILMKRLEGVPGITMYYNSNVVGVTYAAACVGAAAALASTRLARWQSALLFVSAIVLLFAVVLTQSRGSLVAALVGIGAGAMMAAGWRRRLAAVVLIALVGAVLAATPLLASVVQQIADKAYVRGDSRFDAWVLPALVLFWCVRAIVSQRYVRWICARAHFPDRAGISGAIVRIAVVAGIGVLVVVCIPELLNVDAIPVASLGNVLSSLQFALYGALAALAILTSVQFGMISHRLTRIEQSIRARRVPALSMEATP